MDQEVETFAEGPKSDFPFGLPKTECFTGTVKDDTLVTVP